MPGVLLCYQLNRTEYASPALLELGAPLLLQFSGYGDGVVSCDLLLDHDIPRVLSPHHIHLIPSCPITFHHALSRPHRIMARRITPQHDVNR